MIVGYQEKVTVERLTQTYNLLLNATKQMIQDESLTIEQFGSTPEERGNKYWELLPNYLKIVDKCAANIDGGKCLTGYLFYYNRLVGKAHQGFYDNRYVLANGAVISLKPGESCQQDMSLTKHGTNEIGTGTIVYGTYLHQCGHILVDINGKKGPNTTDKDIFNFVLVQDGVLPTGSPKEVIWTEMFDNQCLGIKIYNPNGYCSAWVIYNKNMDYLHCPDKLGWKKASSCKD